MKSGKSVIQSIAYVCKAIPVTIHNTWKNKPFNSFSNNSAQPLMKLYWSMLTLTPHVRDGVAPWDTAPRCLSRFRFPQISIATAKRSGIGELTEWIMKEARAHAALWSLLLFSSPGFPLYRHIRENSLIIMLQSAAWNKAGPVHFRYLLISCLCVCVCSVAAGNLGPSPRPERNTDWQKTRE